jgi:PPOX class probable F420-dependent enzyme
MLGPEWNMAQTKIPDAFMDLINQKKAFAYLATVNPDGSPQVTPVWFDMSGEHLRVNTARGRIKDRNMQMNAAVALSISDPDDPYRHLSLRGRIVHITEEGAEEHIHALSMKYDGKRFSIPAGQKRVIYEIEPVSIFTKG